MYTTKQEFFGKVVRVNLRAMRNTSTCMKSIWSEHYNTMRRADGTYRTKLVRSHSKHLTHSINACVMIIDLKSKYGQAVGFRKGFVDYPYGYLSAGHYATGELVFG